MFIIRVCLSASLSVCSGSQATTADLLKLVQLGKRISEGINSGFENTYASAKLK